jgi:hypothetical protein
MKTFLRLYFAVLDLKLEMFQISVVEKIKHIFKFFFFENYAVYEIMWENMVESDTLEMKI